MPHGEVKIAVGEMQGRTHETGSVAKVIELVGTSPKGFDDAVRRAAQEASKTLHGLTGIEVIGMTAKVDDKGEIREYKATCKIAFQVER